MTFSRTRLNILFRTDSSAFVLPVTLYQGLHVVWDLIVSFIKSFVIHPLLSSWTEWTIVFSRNSTRKIIVIHSSDVDLYVSSFRSAKEFLLLIGDCCRPISFCVVPSMDERFPCLL